MVGELVMTSILITGSNGYIARNIASRLKNCEITFTNRTNLNPINTEEVDNFFKDKYFDVVLHTAIKGGTRLTPDENEIVYQNCLMHFNILKNQDRYGKYISFGSGAEFDRATDIDEYSAFENCLPKDAYGMSKWFIANSGDFHQKFYNIRIFNIFNEDELPSRMIKGNIFRYINKENMIIHQDKYMDFMYFDDFMQIINFYIENEDCPKSINCCYKEKYLLSDIASFINNLSDHKVNIEILNETLGNSYIGKFELDDYSIKVNNLENGIEACYDYYLKNGQ
jgi:nucleoside-diphosphate-sugar epimerase